MENSTKAFIIAGSILIIIILISVGIRVIRSTEDVSVKTDVVSSNMQTGTFNAQFESYFGTQISGTRVKTLLSKIVANNVQNPEHIVFVDVFDDVDHTPRTSAHTEGDSNKEKLQEISNSVKDNYVYWVDASSHCGSSDAGYLNGFLKCLSITRKQ